MSHKRRRNWHNSSENNWNRNRHQQNNYNSHYINNNNNYNSGNNNDNSESIEPESSADDNEIPGFYYDHIKKKHFRIQANNQGVQSVITNEFMKNRSQQDELEKKTKTQLKDRMKFLEIANEQQFGISQKLRIEYNDKRIVSHRLNTLFHLEDNNEKIKKLSLIGEFRNYQGFMHVLLNLVSSPYLFKIFQVNAQTFDEKHRASKSNHHHHHKSYKQCDTATFNRASGVYERNVGGLTSFLPAYVQNGDFLVSTCQVFNSNYRRTISYNLNISKLDLTHAEYVLLEQKHSKSYMQPLWCSVLNSTSNKYLAGLPTCAQMNNIDDNLNIQLNTALSDAYCVRFKDVADKLAFVGCKNKFLYGYDLRQNTLKNSINSWAHKLQHKSCLNCILFPSADSNYVYSNDFSGEV